MPESRDPGFPRGVMVGPDARMARVLGRNKVQRRERVEAEASRLMDAGVAGQAFPGGVACISWREGDELLYVDVAAGRLRAGEPEVKPSTPYDLASVTKPVVAVTALRLVAAG